MNNRLGTIQGRDKDKTGARQGQDMGTAATMVRIFFLGPNSDFLLERGPKMVRILCKSQNFQLNTRMIL